jgi:hypothetical protein
MQLDGLITVQEPSERWSIHATQFHSCLAACGVFSVLQCGKTLFRTFSIFAGVHVLHLYSNICQVFDRNLVEFDFELATLPIVVAM